MDREININNIVILIGQDVIGKFTIIDAYENFDILGKEKTLDISCFYNEDPICKNWEYNGPTYEESVKFR